MSKSLPSPEDLALRGVEEQQRALEEQLAAILESRGREEREREESANTMPPSDVITERIRQRDQEQNWGSRRTLRNTRIDIARSYLLLTMLAAAALALTLWAMRVGGFWPAA